MLNAKRFDHFENTILYNNYGKCLNWNKDLVDVKDYEMYKHNLEFLLTTFECLYDPTEEQIEAYISNYEDIDEDDVEDFTNFIKTVFEKSYEIHHACRLLYNKSVKVEQKTVVKDKVNNDKEILKNIKQAEKEEQRRLKREARELEKETKKKQLDKYNNQNIRCCCGLTYVRIKKRYHITSHKHEDRMEAIKWVLQPDILQEYTNNNIKFDTDSAVSLTDIDDNSTISSKDSV